MDIEDITLGQPVIYRGKTYSFPGHVCGLTDDEQVIVRAVGTPDGHYSGMKHIYGPSQLEPWDGVLSASPAPVPAGDWVMVPRAIVDETLSTLDNYADPTGYTDAYGEQLPADAEQHQGLLAEDGANKLRAALAAAPTPPAPAQPAAEPVEKLGRFGHHPDPAIDFEVEVETIQGLLYDATHGVTSLDGIPGIVERIDRAMEFRVGGDLGAVAAKQMLRGLEKEAKKYGAPAHVAAEAAQALLKALGRSEA